MHIRTYRIGTNMLVLLCMVVDCVVVCVVVIKVTYVEIVLRVAFVHQRASFVCM